MARSEGESGELLKGAHLDPSKLTEGAPKAAVFPHFGFLNSHEFSPAGGVTQVCLTLSPQAPWQSKVKFFLQKSRGWREVGGRKKT